jgi:polysaccharide export outer membrane protein
MNKFLCLCVLLISSVPQLSSQATLQRRPSMPAEYVLGSGDQLLVHVSDVDEITDRPLTIDPSGYVDLPLAGRVEASGLTLTQFKTELTDKFSKYVTTPEISVNLAGSSSQPVSVVGEVNNAGVHQLGGAKRLLEVISLSGGVKNDAGPSVIVTRDPRYGRIPGGHSTLDANGYSTATFSLDDLLSAKHPEDNIPIEPNDVISIPKAELVYVLGDVKKAGGFQLSTHPSVSLLKALSLAEGLGPDSSEGHARILRQYPGGDGTPQEIPVDIKKIMSGKAPDVQLVANDVLYIPNSAFKITSRRAAEAAIGITTGILIYH